MKLIDAPEGATVRFVTEGVVTHRSSPTGHRATVIDAATGRSRLYLNRDAMVTDVEVVSLPALKWQPGDVVVIRYYDTGTAYTYVRGAHSWHGEHRERADVEVSRLYREGKVEHVLRDGKPVEDAPKAERIINSPEPLAPLMQELRLPSDAERNFRMARHTAGGGFRA